MSSNKPQHVMFTAIKEEGTITTPFDMRVQNEIDRFQSGKECNP